MHRKGIAAFDTVAAIDEQLAASVQRIRGTAPVTWEQRSDFYLRNPKFARLVNKRRSLVNNALIDARNQAIHHERAVKGPAWKPDEEESGGKGCKSGGLSDEVCDNIRTWQEWKRGR